jgi:hypothetical protein
MRALLCLSKWSALNLVKDSDLRANLTCSAEGYGEDMLGSHLS